MSATRDETITPTGFWTGIGVILSMLLVGIAGCTDSAEHQFGYTEPGIAASHGLFGTKVRISSEFSGKADLKRNPETGQFEDIHVEMTSGVADVYDAQGRRITENFLKGRELEYGFKVEATREVFVGLNGLADKAVSLMSMGFARGGSDGPQLVNQGQSLLSSVMSSMSGLGGGGDLSALVAMLEARIKANPAPTSQPSP